MNNCTNRHLIRASIHLPEANEMLSNLKLRTSSVGSPPKGYFPTEDVLNRAKKIE